MYEDTRHLLYQVSQWQTKTHIQCLQELMLLPELAGEEVNIQTECIYLKKKTLQLRFIITCLYIFLHCCLCRFWSCNL